MYGAVLILLLAFPSALEHLMEDQVKSLTIAAIAEELRGEIG